jgi:DNA-binding NarL/FixJ family response regulator
LVRRPTVLLADDDQAFLDQVCQLLKSEFEVVGTVGDGQALLAAASDLQPDLCVVDISMPRLNGFQAARQLKREQPSARILFLSVHEEAVAVSEALAIGVDGYVVKRSAATDLIPALQQVFQGNRFVSEAIRH